MDQFEAVDAGTATASTLEVDGAVVGDRGDQTQALRVQFVVVAQVWPPPLHDDIAGRSWNASSDSSARRVSSIVSSALAIAWVDGCGSAAADHEDRSSAYSSCSDDAGLGGAPIIAPSASRSIAAASSAGASAGSAIPR